METGRVGQLIAPSLEEMGYELVRVQITGGRSRTLQIMAERKDRRSMTVEDCERISRRLSAILEVEDPLQGPYSLEASSPGLERPLVKPEDYVRFAGSVAVVHTVRPLNGRSKFRGRLIGVRDGRIAIKTAEPPEETEIAFDDIRRAKLALTEELIASAYNRRNG